MWWCYVMRRVTTRTAQTYVVISPPFEVIFVTLRYAFAMPRLLMMPRHAMR